MQKVFKILYLGDKGEKEQLSTFSLKGPMANINTRHLNEKKNDLSQAHWCDRR